MQPALQKLKAVINGPRDVRICGEPGTRREATERAIPPDTMLGVNGSLENLLRESTRPLESGAPFIIVEPRSGPSRKLVFGTDRSGYENLDRISFGNRLRCAFGGT